MFKIKNPSKNMMIENHKNMLLDLYSHIKTQLDFQEDISELNFLEDPVNQENPLGQTAFYEPSSKKVCIYSSGRHIKDIMRSFAHELIHHHQNCNNKLQGDVSYEDGYAQKNNKMRNLEKEAYLKGNILFRDWEDYRKNKSMGKNIKNESLRDTLKKALLTGLVGGGLAAGAVKGTETYKDELEHSRAENEKWKQNNAIDGVFGAKDRIHNAELMGYTNSIKSLGNKKEELKENENMKKFDAKVTGNENKGYTVKFYKNGVLKDEAFYDEKDSALFVSKQWKTGKFSIYDLEDAKSDGYMYGEPSQDELEKIEKSLLNDKDKDFQDWLRKAEPGMFKENTMENNSMNKPKWTAKVKFDKEWQEYVVKFYKDGVHYEPADYFTDDKEDALMTAKNGPKQMNNNVGEESANLNEVRTGIDPYKQITLLESRRKVVQEETIKALGVTFNMDALLEYSDGNKEENDETFEIENSVLQEGN